MAPWMAPWTPRNAKKRFWGVLRVLRGLTPGKRQAWTPGKSYWWHSMAPWMAPWTPRKSCWCGLSALACRVKLERHATKQPRPAGSRVPKKPLEGFGGFSGVLRVLKGLTPGKRQAWMPGKCYWWHLAWRLERQEKAVDVALVRWPAGPRVPNKPLQGFGRFFEAFGGFWEVLKRLKPGKRQAWTPVKSNECTLNGALNAKKRQENVLGLLRVLRGLTPGKRQAWTPGKSYWWHLMAPCMAPWTPRKSCWCGLSALACRVKLECHATKQPRPAGSRVPKKPLEGFGGFSGVLRVLKGLTLGKRQAWTPVKSYWWHLAWRLERKKKLLM